MVVVIQQIPLNLIVIKVLSSGELSGYELMKRIPAETGYWKPSPGTMYPLLEKLEKRGLVVSRAEGKRKIYRLTAKAKVFMKIADAKKAAMAKYAICCLRTYKFLFGDDITVPLIEEDDYIPKFFSSAREAENEANGFFREMIELRSAVLSAAGHKNPKKIERIRNMLKRTSEEIKKINTV